MLLYIIFIVTSLTLCATDLRIFFLFFIFESDESKAGRFLTGKLRFLTIQLFFSQDIMACWNNQNTDHDRLQDVKNTDFSPCLSPLRKKQKVEVGGQSQHLVYKQ